VVIRPVGIAKYLGLRLGLDNYYSDWSFTQSLKLNLETVIEITPRPCAVYRCLFCTGLGWPSRSVVKYSVYIYTQTHTHIYTHIYTERESISKMLGQLSRVSSRHQNKEKNHSNIFPQTGFEAEIPRLPVSNP